MPALSNYVNQMLKSGRFGMIEPYTANAETSKKSKKSRLRVALFTGNYDYIRDGVAVTLNRLVNHLEAENIPTMVVAPSAPKPALEAAGTVVRVPSLPIPARSEYRLGLELSRQAVQSLEAFQPTLFHIATPDIVGHQALRLAEKWGLPVAASYHTRYDAYPRYYGLKFLGSVWRNRARRFYQRCSCVFVPSLSAGEILQRDNIASTVKLWSRGVDHQHFNPSKRSDAWRRSLGFQERDVVVTYVGRLVREKNVLLLKDIFKKLALRGLKFKISIVGDGPLDSSLRRDLPDAAFSGFLVGENLATAYASSDIFLFPSSSETFGNVTLEAMSSGLPVVCARGAGNNCLVAEGENGLFAETNESGEFADSLQDLIENAALRRSMGIASLKRSRLYDWDTILDDLVQDYGELVGDSAKVAVTSLGGDSPGAVPSPVLSGLRD